MKTLVYDRVGKSPAEPDMGRMSSGRSGSHIASGKLVSGPSRT